MSENIEQKIKLTFENNAEDTSKEVNKLSGTLDKTDDSQKKVTKSTKETTKAHEAAAKGAKGQVDALEKLGGSIGSTISSMKDMAKQLWVIVSNPIVLTIVAIVGALALMAKAFTNSFEGGKKLEQIMSGVGAAGQSLVDNLEKIGSAIVKVFTLDFSGAKKELGEVVNAATSAYGKMAKLKKEAQQLDRDQADNDLDAIKRQAKLADLKDKLLDDSISINEKKKIQKELLKASQENAKEDLELAKKIANNKIATLTLEKDGAKKNYVEIQKIKADQLKGEIENSRELKQIRKQGATLDREELTRAKSIADAQKIILKEKQDALKALRKAQLDNDMQSAKDALAIIDALNKSLETPAQKETREYNEKKAVLEANNLSTEALTKQHNDNLNKIIIDSYIVDADASIKKTANAKATADKEIAIAQALADQKEKNKNDILATGDALIEGAKMLAGKNKGLQKAAIIAEGAMSLGKVGVNIATGVSKDAATGAVASVPQIIKTLATGAISTASIISNTARALKAVGGGGSGLSDSGRQSAPSSSSATPQVNFQASSENQIGNTLAGRLNEQAPIRVTVLENDITKVQANVQAKVVSNSF